MNKNKVLKFELTSKDIKIKELLNDDFLRISVRCMSDVNPNRNMSHFTLDSMKKAVERGDFYNKPILGNFKVDENDFGGHDDDGVVYDPETDDLYYSYDGANCERILGSIRESDRVEIVYDEKQKVNWVEFDAILWTKYCYAGVKKLLKSRKKKISCEIEVIDSYIREDNVEEILDFNYLGTTILSDKLETGIQDAGLVLLDLIDDAVFQKKQTALCFAYKSLEQQNKVEVPAEQDSNIKGTFDEEVPVENEEEPEITMEEHPNENVDNTEEKGGNVMPIEQLTMRAKMELLEQALNEALCKPAEDNGDEVVCYCCVWVNDICDKFVYFEFEGERYRCPYMFVQTEESNKVILDLESKERVVPTWAVFSEEEPKEDENPEEQPKETEACGDKQEEACGDKQEEACGDKQEEACGEAKFEHQGEEGEGHKCIECTIRDLIIDEEEAIQGYSHAEKHFEEEYPLIAKIFHELKEEEETHIGELQQCLQMINDESQEHIEEGIEEAKQIIAEEILENMEEPEEEPENKPEEGVVSVEFAEEEPKENEPKEEEPKEDEPKEEEPKEEEPKEEMANEGDAEKEIPDAEEPEDDDNDGIDDDSDDDNDGKGEDEKPDENDSDKDDDEETDEPDSDDDDDDDDDEDDDDKEEPKDNKEEPAEEEFAAGGEVIDINKEPDQVDVEPKTMPEIIEETVASIKAPEVQTEVTQLGNANEGAQEVLNKNTKAEIIGMPPEMPESIEPEIDPEADKVEQPDDNKKALEFSSNAETSPELAALLEKYAELEAKFNQLNESKKMEEAEKLAKFGAEFINKDNFVDEEAKKDFTSQVEEKCKAYELNSEEEVTKFAKSLMAMYYYEKQSVVASTKKGAQQLCIAINRPSYVDGNASNKLKDAINKLNYLNKEE